MSLSIIIPTIGRESLSKTLESLDGQTADQDEVLVVHDGTRLESLHVDELGPVFLRSRGRYEMWVGSGPHNDWGASSRNLGMRHALGERIMFLDDDDVYVPGALNIVRDEIALHPRAILFFQMEFADGRETVWKDKEIRSGNLGSPCLCMPRDCVKPRWDGRFYDQDFRFFRDLVGMNPDREVVWVEKVIARIRP